jgi:sodium/pantothenate symporter
MMSYPIATTLLIVLYAVFTLRLVYKSAKKNKNIRDYALGSGFSPWVVGLSLAASVTSAATFIINPGFVALYGWSAFLAMSVVLPLGLILSLVILSKSFRKFGAHIQAITLAQWVGRRYQSPRFSLLMAGLSLLLMTFIVLICVGLTKVLQSALGVDEVFILAGLIFFVFGYIMFGGANSMIYTNALQATAMLVVALVLLGSGYEYISQGVDSFWTQLASIDPLLTQPFNPSSPLFRDYFEVIIANFVVGIAIVCQPHIITRSLMLRKAEDMNFFLVLSISVLLVFFSVLFVGFYARLANPSLTLEGTTIPMDGILSSYVVHRFSVTVGIVVIIGLLSAGLSTLEGIVQSLSTTLTNDMIAPLSGISDAAKLQDINRWVIVLLGILAFVWSYQQLLYPNLSVALLAQNGVYAFFSSAFVPVLFGIFLKETPVQAAMGAAITAIFVHFCVYYGELSFYTSGVVKNPAVASCYAIIAALLVGGLMYYFRGVFSSPVMDKKSNVKR